MFGSACTTSFFPVEDRCRDRKTDKSPSLWPPSSHANGQAIGLDGSCGAHLIANTRKWQPSLERKKRETKQGSNLCSSLPKARWKRLYFHPTSLAISLSCEASYLWAYQVGKDPSSTCLAAEKKLLELRRWALCLACRQIQLCEHLTLIDRSEQAMTIRDVVASSEAKTT